MITSKTRIKLLTKFFLNAGTTAYLRHLEAEFGESTNAIRVELNRLERVGLLQSEVLGNKKIFKANSQHPYFPDINRLLLKFVGIDHVIEQVVLKVGHLLKAFVVGDFAKGMPGKIIDIVLVGHNFDYNYLNQLIQKAEENVSFKIRYFTIKPEEESTYISSQENVLLIWSADK
ncbi:MAG: ArsR family transcriptional regulator [Bacteroidales bacterium]